MTDTLVWDETGARYYETGVSKGTFFPIDGSVGVPWNGLVAVSLDPQGGEPESYYFDGIKYMDRVLAEAFQATVQCISTPLGFEACEGDREYAPGVMTSFNKRDKFHMSWRTEIGNDQGESVAYKIHISYNNLAQPAGRNYQTVSDSTSMDVRSFTITATPACGRHSYFWFDSRKYDLTDLEARLIVGDLPKCWELKDLVTPIGVEPVISDEDCARLFEDFEEYLPGQVVSDDKISDDGLTEIDVEGLINNGLNITELPATGAFAANDSAASEVGTGDILADGDDATYISSADGDLGYTVALPSLAGYLPGATFELHIRLSVSGDISEDDPDNLDADAQVHISTDAEGDNTIGGFSDGTDEGVGFAITAVDGTPVNYVVPLKMDAWVDTTIDDVVAALEAGAYLNVVGISNNNPNSTPEVAVYEMSVFMLDATDQNRALRAPTLTDTAETIMHVYESGTTDLVAACTYEVDFKYSKRMPDDSYIGYQQNPMTNSNFVLLSTFSDGGIGDTPVLEYYDGDVSHSVPVASFNPEDGKWYHVSLTKDWSIVTLVITDRDSGVVVLQDTHASSADPTAYMEFKAGYVGNSE